MTLSLPPFRPIFTLAEVGWRPAVSMRTPLFMFAPTNSSMALNREGGTSWAR